MLIADDPFLVLCSHEVNVTANGCTLPTPRSGHKKYMLTENFGEGTQTEPGFPADQLAFPTWAFANASAC